MSSATQPARDAGNDPTVGLSADGLAATQDVGSSIGRYNVLYKLGSGGMGVVYLARDPELDRDVALKLLKVRGPKTDADTGDGHSRLLREAQAMAKVSHPNLVPVYDVGVVATGGSETRPYVAMEFVDGMTLSKWLVPHRGTDEILAVFSEAGRGLAAAHAAGLTHRDFKPSNVLVGKDGRVRVMDFGLARAVSSEDPPRGIKPVSAGETLDVDMLASPLTDDGIVMGTPAYMAPEQHVGKTADARSDQFSFCVSLYEALFGERPFVSRRLKQLAKLKKAGPPTPDHRFRDVPPRITAAVLRGLDPEPERRWPSVPALLAELAPRRRRLWPWALVAVGGGTLALAFAQTGAATNGCEGKSAIDDVWNDAQRDNVETAISGTEVPYAQGTSERVQIALAEYADRWTAAYEKTCRDLVDDPALLDQAMICMRGRLASLRSTVSVLSEVDHASVERAVVLAQGLASPERCTEIEYLATEVLAPEDVKTARDVESIREEISDAVTMRRAGKERLAKELAQRAYSKARALPYAPIKAEAACALGLAADDERDLERAAQLHEEGYLAAVESGHHRAAYECARSLVTVVGEEKADLDAGRRWARHARSALERLGEDPDRDAQLAHAEGVMLKLHADFDGAQGRLEIALDQLEADPHADALDLATALNSWANLLSDRGDFERALDAYGRAKDLVESTLGAQHPTVGTALNNIGLALQDTGRWDEALEHYRRSLRITQAALGPDHATASVLYNNIGNALMDLRRFDQAVESYLRALAIRKNTYGDDHPKVAMTLNNLGTAYRATNRSDEAVEAFSSALSIWEGALGRDHPDVAMALNNLGVQFELSGRYDDAARHHQRALNVRREALGPNHPLVARSLSNLAVCRLKQGKLDESVELGEQVVRLRVAALGDDHPDVADGRYHLGLALSERGDKASAKHELDSALRIYEARADEVGMAGVREALEELGAG